MKNKILNLLTSSRIDKYIYIFTYALYYTYKYFVNCFQNVYILKNTARFKDVYFHKKRYILYPQKQKTNQYKNIKF